MELFGDASKALNGNTQSDFIASNFDNGMGSPFVKHIANDGHYFFVMVTDGCGFINDADFFLPHDK
jgi:hypothetical protein